MKLKAKGVAAAALGACILAAGGTAYAATSTKNPGNPSQAQAADKHGKKGKHHLRLVVKAAADYIGISPKDVREGLKSGHSLAALATANQKSVQGLEDAILAGVKAQLDKAVAAHKFDAAKEQMILDKLTARIDKLVNKTFQKKH